MSAPVVTFRETTSGNPIISSWNIGTVPAGTVSSSLNCYVYNNYDAETGISDMEDVTIKTLSINNLTEDTVANGGEIIANNYIEVKCISYGDNTWNPIGSTTEKAIGYTTGVDKICGTGATENRRAELYLRANIPSTATASTAAFKVVVCYDYS